MRGLSTGNRRKVGLVGAFMARPELLILDEPTNGLDPLMQQVFLTTVEEAREHGQSVLLSSHILSEVERVADLVAVLQGGKLAASGPTRELRRQAAQRFHITFAEGQDVPLDALAALDGASGVERRRPEGQEVSLAWAGSPDALLTFLADHRITTLTAPEPDLEEAFLEYYQQDVPSSRSSTAETYLPPIRCGSDAGRHRHGSSVTKAAPGPAGRETHVIAQLGDLPARSRIQKRTLIAWSAALVLLALSVVGAWPSMESSGALEDFSTVCRRSWPPRSGSTRSPAPAAISRAICTRSCCRCSSA
ncbi:Vitamin B12 import ATP-binding protein BtuD [Streptomyces cyaneofuscatus]